MPEAKHDIYRDCLCFPDFSNFDGVRFAYKAVFNLFCSFQTFFSNFSAKIMRKLLDTYYTRIESNSQTINEMRTLTAHVWLEASHSNQIATLINRRGSGPRPSA